ncbi:hypothetical protein LSCM1_01763 [Leishmania martiniquensis]|uniref:Uncharacterized protein n=1 Tax=Leishmania martiniquensis TaxID=1580590 RepID=A0A836GBV7_9TRYP|nr:hypothetical protein LSCM1_01763 [Leishmania martiniquensis]
MHSSAWHGDSLSPRQDDLQWEIEEKERELNELYQRWRHVRARKLPQHTRESDAEARDVPQLRIRRSPDHLRHSRPAAPSTPPLCGMGPSESILIGMTSERRRLSSRTVSHNCGSYAAAMAAQPTLPQNWPSPSMEFATRLSRLYKASVLSSATVPEAATVTAAVPCQLSDSLAVSPIATVSPACEARSSEGSYLSGASCFLECCGEVSCVSVGEVEGGRHVRFSSRSPQVATFSVERPCALLTEGSIATSGAVTAAPAGPMTEVKRLTPKSELDLVENALSGHSRRTSPWVSTPARSPAMTSGNRSIKSARTSATSYLAQIGELRSSLRQEPPGTCHSVRSVGTGPRLSLYPIGKQETRETPLLVSVVEAGDAQDSRGGGSTPPSRSPRDDSRGLDVSVGAAAVGISSAILSGALGPNVPVTEGSPPTTAMSDTFECFTDSSPIFLRRPPRGPDLPARASCALPFSNLTNRPRQLSAQMPQKLGESGPRSTAATSKTKKCVRFRDSVERVEQKTAGTLSKRRRPGQKLPPAPTSPPASAGMPITIPAELCFEQEGFGAGILLACGPTLFFD